METHYGIGDNVIRIQFDKGRRFKLHLSGSDIRYRTDGQNPTPDAGEYLQAGSSFILNAIEITIDFRAIRVGKEDTILTIIPLDKE